MNTFAAIALILALFSIVAVLGLGLFAMVKGGEFNEKYGNKLMQARVLLQGLALALLALAYYSSHS
ncbi:MAG: twin transmembrane helix small protein [Alphaproteobacteria bacterium]